MNKPELAAAVLRDLANNPTIDTKKLPGIGMMNTIVSAVFDTIENATKTDEVRVQGFGTFHRATSAAREGNHPQHPGQKITIPAKSRLTFKCSKTQVETIE